jgi:hypothetical protein
MTKSIDNLWWTKATSDGGLLRLPRMPDLNVSRLPWLQAAPAKGFLSRRRNMAAPKGRK